MYLPGFLQGLLLVFLVAASDKLSVVLTFVRDRVSYLVSDIDNKDGDNCLQEGAVYVTIVFGRDLSELFSRKTEEIYKRRGGERTRERTGQAFNRHNY